MNTKDRKETLLKAIDRYRTEAAYNAVADISHYKTLKAQAEKDMETAKANNDRVWYERRKSAAAACARLINEAMKKIRGAKAAPAKNKAMSVHMVKNKDNPVK